jgi:hypothetical protein
MILTSATVFLSPGADSQKRYYNQAGEGVDIYVLDTGIRLSHRLLKGKAINLNSDETYHGLPWVSFMMYL